MSDPTTFGDIRGLLHERAFIELAGRLLDAAPDVAITEYLSDVPEIPWAREYANIERMTPETLGAPKLEHLTTPLARWRSDETRPGALAHFRERLPAYLETDRAHPTLFETLRIDRFDPDTVGGLYLCTAPNAEIFDYTQDILLSEHTAEELWMPESALGWDTPAQEPQRLPFAWVCNHHDLGTLEAVGLDPETMRELRPPSLHRFAFTNLRGQTCVLALLPDGRDAWLRIWSTRNA